MSAEQKYKCEICGKMFKTITNSHLKKHDLTTREYREIYPNALFGNFERFNKWLHSNENKINCKKMSDKVYGNLELRQKRKNAVILSTTSIEYKEKQSAIMKKVAKTDKMKEFYSEAKSRVTDWMKKSNFERWEIKFGKEEAEKRSYEWSQKNILPSTSKNTKPELLFKDILEELNLEFEQQKSIGKYKCDFYIPEYNLVVEVDGDYWHANPSFFKETDMIGPKNISAKDIWNSDNQKSQFILNKGYNLLRYWSTDINNISYEKIFEDIVQASKKLDDSKVAIPFHSSVRIKLGAGAHIEGPDKEPIGINVSAKIIKNKVSAPFRSADFQIIFGKGIREHEEVFDALRKYGEVQMDNKSLIIEGAGAWKSFIVKDTIQDKVLIEKKFYKAEFDKIMNDPQYKDYIDFMIDKAYTRTQDELSSEDLDIDPNSYVEQEAIAQYLVESEFNED